ncbi:TIGR03936 family radical SAM-associated protein [Adlercreutzia sp. ZJ154]|uniref:TIGR03936 family radical SAM-associated protein n=1 Tax=Adlercreutzia sp. ZJ154 TaxID=2709790 RepID=UPI0013EAFC30|nr:TIGR03936 family radical SAM-associated protein [Adlercreutzia sp. ZJ154]
MADPRLFRLRVTYSKSGRLAMLSHLEVARALERTVRRAGLPFAVTNGFSPHMRIAFGAALPVGVGGNAEFFDIFLTSYLAPKKALEALRNFSAPDLMPTACEYVEPSAAAASVACPVSTYEALLSASVGGLEIPDTVEVVRKKKRKVLEVREFLVGDVCVSGNSVVFTLQAKPTGSLRADIFLDACIDLLKINGVAPNDLCIVSINRIAQNSSD